MLAEKDLLLLPFKRTNDHESLPDPTQSYSSGHKAWKGLTWSRNWNPLYDENHEIQLDSCDSLSHGYGRKLGNQGKNDSITFL